MKGLSRHIQLFYRPFVWPMVAVIGFIIAENAIGLSIPWVQGLLINELIAHDDLRQAITIVALIFVGWTVLEILIYFRWHYNLYCLDRPLKLHVMRVTMERLTRLSLGQHQSRHSGVKLSTINEGRVAIRDLMDTLVFQIAPTVTEICGVVVLLALANGWMAVVVITGAFIFTVWARILNKQVAEPLKSHKKDSHREGKFRNDVMRNMPLVLLTSQEDRAVNESVDSFERIVDDRLDIWVPYGRKATYRDMTLIFTRIGVILVGVWLVWTGQVLVGSVFTWWMWSGNVTNRIGNIGRIWRKVMEDVASAEVYIDLLEIDCDVPIAQYPIRPQRFSGQIDFKDVYLTYAGSRKAHTDGTEGKEFSGTRASLHDVNLSIKAGQRVAFVGPSGAGKSTLVYALMRGQDLDSGSITIDGHNLKDLDPQTWRAHVGIVPQTVFLFDKSLRYNLCWPTDPDTAPPTQERLEHIARMACLTERIEGLEYGYDTIIGERGVRLSGGEQQRVGIARAIINDPDVLIFDEATSSLDTRNERLIHDAIRTAGKGRTTIIIAHRLSTVRDADCIFVVDDGTIVGAGTHDELLVDCTTYKELIENQMTSF